MNELQTYINTETQKLDALILELQNFLATAPVGTLRIAQKKPNQYYWMNKAGNSHGQYLRKSQVGLVQQLAQKDYTQKLLKHVLEQKSALAILHTSYDWRSIEHFDKNLSLARQQLIIPYILSDDTYASEWLHSKKMQYDDFNNKKASLAGVAFTTIDKYPLTEDTGIFTDNNELVRSKTEKIIADKLYKKDIPYVYEMPLFLKGQGYISPDFTVLNKRTRREFYWEHFGMMNNPEYSDKAIKKIATYEKNHIYQGKQLLITYESSSQPLNMRNLDSFINEFLL